TSLLEGDRRSFQRMRKRLFAAAAAVLVLGVVAATVAVTLNARAATAAPTSQGGIPRYQHIFYIMMENQAYHEIIGQSDAPNINALANKYGLATSYYGVTHPSEPNYVAAVGGSYFTVANTPTSDNVDESGDNAYYCAPTSALPECAGTTG